MHSHTLETESASKGPNSRQHSPTRESYSLSGSPVRPPYSPITPTLHPASLATSNNGAPKQTSYTHYQPAQTAISQPDPITVTFNNNPDVLATKAALSVLLLQKQNAERDIGALQATKERALADPGEFLGAIRDGEIKSRGDNVFDHSLVISTDDDDNDDHDDNREEEDETKMGHKRKQERKAWAKLPIPQHVVRAPPINWNQYAVVGESLNKLHADQKARPTEGVPQRLGPDGHLVAGLEGQARVADFGDVAPYHPGRDKIEKMGTRKGGKR